MSVCWFICPSIVGWLVGLSGQLFVYKVDKYDDNYICIDACVTDGRRRPICEGVWEGYVLGRYKMLSRIPVIRTTLYLSRFSERCFYFDYVLYSFFIWVT